MAKNTKTPVMILEELTVKKGFNRPQYDVIYSEQGTHNNTFHYSVTVLGQEAIGVGKSKKEAKHAAAQNILDILINEDILQQEVINEVCNVRTEGPSVKAPENCIPKLNELCGEHNIPAPTFQELSVAGSAHCREFTFECRIASIKTKATAGSKKHAKQLAAKDMLDRIINYVPQIQEELHQFQLMDSNDDILDKYRAVTLDKFKVNLNAKPIESEYVMKKMMEEKLINVEDVLKLLQLDISEDNLEKVLKLFDSKFEIDIIQEEPVPIVAVNVYLDTPLTALGMACDLATAQDKALKKMYSILRSFAS